MIFSPGCQEIARRAGRDEHDVVCGYHRGPLGEGCAFRHKWLEQHGLLGVRGAQC